MVPEIKSTMFPDREKEAIFFIVFEIIILSKA
jgi:hypothetical protein